MQGTAPHLALRFGTFEADLNTGELRKNGVKIKLQEKPFQVLAFLLERPGELITRDELREKLWSADTFVDFDNSIGAAIAKLRQALGDSAQNPRFVETVANRGYRLLVPVSVSEPSQAQQKPRRARRFPSTVATILLGGALLVVVVLVFDFGGARQWLGLRSNRPIHSLAVLPLENLSGDPAQDYLADGMTDELITNLARVGNIRVISRTSTMQYKGTKKSLQQIGRELNVDAVVEGSVARSGQHIRVTAQLLDAKNDQHLWAQIYERDLGDSLILQGEISRTIAREIHVKLTPQQGTQVAKNSPVDLEVQEDYLKGRYHLNKGTQDEIRNGIHFFEQAVARDPNDSHGYAGLAESYVALSDYYLPDTETLAKAKEAVARALELDDSLAEAHASLGVVRYMYDWDWPGAEKEFRRAIELNPGLADVHGWYAIFLGEMGHSSEAVAEVVRAESLDPLSLRVHVNAGWVYYLARQNKQAIEEWREALDLEPQFGVSHSSIWVAYLQSPEFAKMMSTSPTGLGPSDDPMTLAALAGLYAVSGSKSQAKGLLSRLESLSKGRFVCPYEMATARAVLGDRDEAISLLHRAYQEHSACIPVMRTDPRLDSLRRDPRFQEILRNLQFPQ